MNILLTGSVGFIGHHVALSLLKQGFTVLGVDRHVKGSDRLKRLQNTRLHLLSQQPGYKHRQVDVADVYTMSTLFRTHRPQIVIHLAAHAGVRDADKYVNEYAHDNLLGFASIIEQCREYPPLRLIYASSSSVYGDSPGASKETDMLFPKSLYANTKLENERVAKRYQQLFDVSSTALRLFTVFGIRGRLDMATSIFTDKILRGSSVCLYGEETSRDFTCVDDVVKVFDSLVLQTLRNNDIPPVLNVGSGRPVVLAEYLKTISCAANESVVWRYEDLKEGEALHTHADVCALRKCIGEWTPSNLQRSLASYVRWHRDYFYPQSWEPKCDDSEGDSTTSRTK